MRLLKMKTVRDAVERSNSGKAERRRTCIEVYAAWSPRAPMIRALRVPNVLKSSLDVILASQTLCVSRTVLEQVFVLLEILYPLRLALLELHSRVIEIAAV